MGESNISLPDLNIPFTEVAESLPFGFIVFDENFIIKFTNQNVFEFGIDEFQLDTTLKGKNLLEHSFAEDFEIVDELKNLKNLEPFEKYLKSFTALDGSEIEILLKATPLFSEETFKGGLLIIGDQKKSLDKPIEKKIKKVQASLLKPTILHALCDYYMIIDETGSIVERSEQTVPEFVQKVFPQKINDVRYGLSESDADRFDKALQEVKQSRGVGDIIIELSDDIERKIQLTFMSQQEGEDSLFYILVNDISDKVNLSKETEQELNELRRYQEITKVIVDGVINVDMKGSITFWNESAAKLFGYSRSEVYGKFIGKVIPSLDENYFKILRDEIREQGTWKGEFWTDARDEEPELLSIRMSIIEEEEPYIVILCSSITERANVEKDLRKSEERFRNIVTNTREYICTFDQDGNLTYVNPFFETEFGYSHDEMMRLNIADFIVDDDFKSLDKIKEVYENKTESVELTLAKKDNTKVHVLANFTGVAVPSGTINYFNAVFTDITEKKEAEKDLLMIRTVFEASQDGIAIQNKRKYILVNDSFVKMFGYDSVDDVIGKDPLEFVHEDDYTQVAESIQALERGNDAPKRYNYRGLKKDESIFYVEKSVSSYQTKDGLFIVSTFRDVTNERKALEKLEVSEERYRSITENINDCVWSAERVNGKLKTVFFSDVIKRITGYTSRAFIDDQKLWIKIIHPNDSVDAVSKIRAIYRDPVRNSEELEYRIINDLGNIVWVKNKLNIIRNDNGEVEKVFGLLSDISLSKRGEEELKRSTKELKTLNEAKDRFISIISHDLRTPFSSILGFTDMLLSDRNMNENKQVQYITFIQDAAKNMLSLVNALLDWTRLQTGRINFTPQRINARYVVNRAIEILSGAAMQKNINLVSDLMNDVYIHADENLLLQVFNNLISNAIKFTKEGGSITIGSGPLTRKRQVQFKVKDTGVGISEKDIPKLFKVDTKYTTPGTSGEKGSGLGLSLCYDIIQKHGGEIAVNSEIGKGTEFVFTIPISSTKILLVDDSKTDRLLYSKLLKSIIPDYSVVEAKNGKEAFEIIKDTSPALVITDHNMPVMSGYSLVQQLNLSDMKYKPPVIILSSDISDSIEREYKELGIDFVFKKPVNLTAFKIAVEKSMKKAITG